MSTTGSGWHFLIVKGEIVAKLGFEGKFKRIICTMNEGEGFQCALLPWGELFYIIVNKKKRDAIGIVAGDMVNVLLEKDESKYGLPMPEEFQEVLNQDLAAIGCFTRCPRASSGPFCTCCPGQRTLTFAFTMPYASLIILRRMRER